MLITVIILGLSLFNLSNNIFKNRIVMSSYIVTIISLLVHVCVMKKKIEIIFDKKNVIFSVIITIIYIFILPYYDLYKRINIDNYVYSILISIIF